MSLILSGSDGVSDIDGTVSTPAIRGTDSNTGIFFPAADTIAFTEGGVESMRIDSSGNVGIGTSSPNADSTVFAPVLSVKGGSYDGVLELIGSRADGSATGVGQLRFVQNANTTGKTISYIIGETEGGTANNRGGTLQFWTKANAGSLAERMRIGSDGKVGIGTTNLSGDFTVSNGGANGFEINPTEGSGASTKINSYNRSTSAYTTLQFDVLDFRVGTGSASAPERMRITSSGQLLVGTTSVALNNNGLKYEGSNGALLMSRSGDTPFAINRLTNDGILIDFYQDTVSEGNISVSGSTVSYNGGHLSRWSQLPDGSKDESIVKGTVMSNLDDMCVWEKDGVVADNEQLNKMKVSDVEGDTNVAGVFVNWTIDADYGVDDMNVAMTGDMIIRIADGVVIQKGDLLMSAGDGTAKPQGDDIVRSKTIAKVTSNHVTCTYADGSYCVPCVLMAC